MRFSLDRVVPQSDLSQTLRVLLTIGLLLMAPCVTSYGQGLTQNLRGDRGLMSGSQAPPGVYVTNFTLLYDVNKLKDQDGNSINSISALQAINITAFSFVSKKKFLGGHLGLTVGIPFSSLTIETPLTTRSSPMAMADMFVRPFELGWHQKRADYIVAYGFYAPVGRFTPNATNNKGLGFWSHEFSGGTTFYPEKTRQWNVATLVTLNTQTGVRDTNRKVGNILSLEGGVGRSFQQHRSNAGLAYFMEWKVTHDKNAPLPANLQGKHRYYGLGPEFTTYIPVGKKTMIGLGARWLFDVGNRSATQGNQLYLTFTLARPSPR